MRALISVTDKTGVVQLARALAELGCEIVSTGGTARVLRDAGLSVVDVSEVTGFPETLDGRVKTLHPGVHAGLLADLRNPEHRSALGELELESFDLLAVNLYAFEERVTGDHTLDEAIESIDIGGPAMVRSAAKNHANVLVAIDPADYDDVVAVMRDGASEEFRLRLAAKAFRHTAFYDSMVSRYLTEISGEQMPETWTVGLRKDSELRYGENPHQAAALYRDPLVRPGVVGGRQLSGRALSFNNLLDAEAAWELVCDLPPAACCVVKHGNPCGAGVGSSATESWRLAREGDPIAAFGGIAAFHGALDMDAASALAEKGNFLEVIVASGFQEGVVDLFQNRKGWGKNVRLVEAPSATDAAFWTWRPVRGGSLVQMSDEPPATDWTCVTHRKPTPEEDAALRLAWTLVRHVKSNAIVTASAKRLLGTGAGQMSRVKSAELAVMQAGELAKGAALASDALIPFPDTVEIAAEVGLSAIVQTGGSKKDADVIAAADEAGIAMVFTGVRHFRH